MYRMRNTVRVVATSAVLLALSIQAQTPAYQLSLKADALSAVRTLPISVFGAPGETPGWSIELDLPSSNLRSGTSLLQLTNEGKQTWLEGRVAGATGGEQIQFFLHTDYKSVPLTVAIPLKLLPPSIARHMLLRYQQFRLSFFVDGVLVDEEWPVGVVPTGKSPHLEVAAPVTQVKIWNSALADAVIESANGGAKKIASRADAILGPEPRDAQYSRPRGWDTNAGDVMPFYHDGTFHVFFLFDRRQHHSKWGLGAHQWAHISSTDLVHWRHYPIALPIDHEWEGSICTGSVFFHDGLYYAHYATRMPDHSERLGVAVSHDGIHFNKTLPTPFAEPAPPFLHGPNRDPFIFQDGAEFHMLVTAAVENKTLPDGDEGALEHLVSKDFSTWSVLPQPFLLTGSDVQPECSDLFHWGDWYYLVFGLSGTTHYRMSRSLTGPWVAPLSDILDGPEVKVMKEAEFKGDRRIMVGFLVHDNHYGGDLIFRELVQEKDGSLGTKPPKEMELPSQSTKTLTDMHLGPAQTAGDPIALKGDARLMATVVPHAGSTFAIRTGSPDEEQVIFDAAAGTVTWIDSTGKPSEAKLEHVADLSGQVALVLTLHDTVADLSINGHRTVVHRLLSQPKTLSFSSESGVDVTDIRLSSIR